VIKPPAGVRRKAEAERGKSVDVVVPATKALPEASTVIALASSSPLPSRYVAYSNCLPSELILATKA